MIRFIDLFCGIGGFRFGAEQALSDRGVAHECVFSCDIDKYARRAYKANFGEEPAPDITKVAERDVPDHDLLLAGFPCQPFSIIGAKRGFEDTRGTLFFDIARILRAKRPRAFILENVKQLATHNDGRTFARIREALDELGYHHDHRILNALDYGLPQKRERVFIVGFDRPTPFTWPEPVPNYTPLDRILESDPPAEVFASDHILTRRRLAHQPATRPAIWHENKSGNISSYPYSCALRAGASYNYLLVDGERRLTPREMLRLQGFPESFQIAVSDYQTRRQAGNAVAVNVVKALVDSVWTALANPGSG